MRARSITAVLWRSAPLIVAGVVDPLLVLGNMALIVVSVPEAAWVLVLMVPIMAVPMIRMGRKVQKSSSKSLAAMGDATESMNQMLTGIRTVKSFQLEGEQLQDYRDSNANYLRRTKRMLKAKGFSQGFLFASYQIAFAGSRHDSARSDNGGLVFVRSPSPRAEAVAIA